MCQDGLVCGSNNCPASLGFDSEVDCCYQPHELMSPNYPNSYPNNVEETWPLTTPTGSIITLQFHSFHVRHSAKTCTYSSILSKVNSKYFLDQHDVCQANQPKKLYYSL